MQEQLKKYKELIKGDYLKNEMYKWTLINEFYGRPDLKAENLVEELRSIRYGNLCYKLSIAVLTDLASNYPSETKKYLIDLFDESEDLNERIRVYRSRCKKLYDTIKPRPSDKDYQEERTIATLLTVRNPERYTFYKNSFYSKLCGYLNEEKLKAGQKYAHYLKLLEKIKKQNSEILNDISEIVNSKLPDNYRVKSDLLILQDFIYYEFEVKQKAVKKELNSTQKVWMYAPGENGSKWEEFYKNGIIGLGWDDLGDLNDYENKEEIISRLQELEQTSSSKKNDASANFDFKEHINIGDLVIAKKGRSEYLGYGVITSEYYYDENRESYKKCRKIDWKKEGSWVVEDKKIVLKTLTDITKYTDYVAKLKDLLGIENSNIDEKIMKHSLNQILYGPPGTGKTYSTVRKSLEIVAPIEYNKIKNDDKKINNLFNDLLYDEKNNPSGKIVFSTFHQSFSYEDFIEGIKPNLQGEELSYKIEDGIFKSLVDRCKITSVSNFDEVYDEFVLNLNNTSNEYLILKTVRGAEYRVNVNSNNNLSLYTSQDVKYQGVLSRKKLKAYFFGEQNVYKGWEGYAQGVIEFLTSEYNLSKNSSAKDERFLIIIDEINRGNVSSIFGELITLIEDDKRLGCANEIKVELPYSKEKFGVPPNLHILGTMNTADRSVEALDTALRRRFAFTEMLPKPELLNNKGEDENGLIEGLNLSHILTTINERIEVLVDRDHTIGHAFFMSAKSLEDLRMIFANKVIPLLQEYFYGDYGKMEMVIGSGFFTIKDVSKVKFAVSSEDFEPEGKVYELLDLLNHAILPDDAFKELISAIIPRV